MLHMKVWQEMKRRCIVIFQKENDNLLKIFEGDSKLLKKIREAKVPNNFYVFLKIQDLM